MFRSLLKISRQYQTRRFFYNGSRDRDFVICQEIIRRYDFNNKFNSKLEDLLKSELVQALSPPVREIMVAALKNNNEKFGPFADGIWHNIWYIENPSEEVCLEAVKRDPETIRYIRNPSEKIYIAAVTRDPRILDLIRNQTEKICLAAVNKDPRALQWVLKENQTEEICLAAVKKDPDILRWVLKEIQTEKVRIAAMEADYLIKKQSKN